MRKLAYIICSLFLGNFFLVKISYAESILCPALDKPLLITPYGIDSIRIDPVTGKRYLEPANENEMKAIDEFQKLAIQLKTSLSFISRAANEGMEFLRPGANLRLRLSQIANILGISSILMEYVGLDAAMPSRYAQFNSDLGWGGLTLAEGCGLKSANSIIDTFRPKLFETDIEYQSRLLMIVKKLSADFEYRQSKLIDKESREWLFNKDR